MSLLDLALQQRWAMRPESLRGLLDIIARESLDPDLARQIREDRASRPSALAARAGAKLDGSRTVQVRDGVAILEVTGPIVRRADLFSEISGATSVGTLAADFATALAAPNVRAILLAIDSPGGEVTGIHEFAQMICAARAKKPVWAYVEGLGASAAYWLAAGTDHIVVDDTAILGSIGVVMAVRDPAKAKSDQVEIVSSQSPKKRPDVTTEGGRQQLQALVDATADVFVADVAQLRGVSVETVLDDFGQGDVFVGQAAVAAGLADALGSFEQTLLDIQDAARERAAADRPTRAQQESTPMGINWKSFFDGLFGAAAEAEGAPLQLRTLAEGEMLAEGALPEGAQVTVQAAQLAPARDAQADRIALLEQQLAKQAEQQIQQRAQAFADGAVAKRQALPSEHAHLLAAYTQAATDDAKDSGTRAATLESLVSARPAHTLTQELIGDAQQQVLAGGSGGVSAERRKALLAMTPLGQAAARRPPTA